MKINIFKKIITPIYLLMFVFILIAPLSTALAAPRLTINADTITLGSGDDTFISAKMYELADKTIYFTSSPAEGVIFDPSPLCVTSTTGNPSICSVGFRSIKTGIFTVTASTNYNGTLLSDPIIITITGENVSPTCTSPNILDSTTNKCVPCNTPKIVVGGKCEEKITEEGCKTINRVLNTTTNRCNCVLPNTEVNGLCTTTAKTDTTYTPLAPLPGFDKTIDTAGACPFGNYLNVIIKLILGIAAVLAMVMIVMGGIEYMTSDLISSKESGKETIRNAILGLIIALGAYLILNTINPKLLDACLDNLPTATIVINADELNFKETEQSIDSVGIGYVKGTTNSNVSTFVDKLKNENRSLSLIKVSTKDNRAYFYTGTDWENGIFVPVSLGRAGISEIGKAKFGDFKTPKGTTSITLDRRPDGTPPIEGKAALTRDGKYNMGAAFINIGATIDGVDRGIGFHGNASNTLTKTQGCIRMNNSDLIALAPYMKTGVQIIIE